MKIVSRPTIVLSYLFFYIVMHIFLFTSLVRDTRLAVEKLPTKKSWMGMFRLTEGRKDKNTHSYRFHTMNFIVGSGEESQLPRRIKNLGVSFWLAQTHARVIFILYCNCTV
jgi:hypothetical protein